jgi:hypothetical protein
MSISIAIFKCGEETRAFLRTSLQNDKFKCLEIHDDDFQLIETYDKRSTIVFCDVGFFQSLAARDALITGYSYLLHVPSGHYLNQISDYTFDCIGAGFTISEFEFRVENLLRFQKNYIELIEKNDKLQRFFNKNRNKTIELLANMWT